MGFKSYFKSVGDETLNFYQKHFFTEILSQSAYNPVLMNKSDIHNTSATCLVFKFV